MACLRFGHADSTKPPRTDADYEAEFLRAIREGPLVNTTPYQYLFGSIKVPRAAAEEARLEGVDPQRALDYLDKGAEAWNGLAGCVTCHTNGSYMAYRPALTKHLGAPRESVRRFFESTLETQLKTPRQELLQELGPAQVVYVANGLAQWDAHVTGSLSGHTRRALGLMFELQQQNGAWTRPSDCWPPFESDAYQGASMAALAVAAAPGWLAQADRKQLEGVERLKTYLRSEPPPHDYARVFLLWAASELPGLLSAPDKRKLVDALARHQRADGGWSIRTFARPEEWGSGNRTAKLKAEPGFADPASDGHMTGLVITVLRKAGVPARDERLLAGIRWLLRNQRESGRWWTRSLNTDEWHFVSYSGTAFALLALDSCDALPPTSLAHSRGSVTPPSTRITAPVE